MKYELKIFRNILLVFFDMTILPWSHSLWNVSSNLKVWKRIMRRNNWNSRRIKLQYSIDLSTSLSIKMFNLLSSISGSSITNYESLVKKIIYRNIGNLRLNPPAPTLNTFACFSSRISYAKVKVNWNRN